MRKQKKNNVSRKSSKIFLILLSLFILLLVIFLIIGSGITLNLNKEIKVFNVQDRCGPSPFGPDILHEISTIDGCKIKCLNLCEVLDLKYVSHEFFTENLTCYDCECSCK